MSTQHTITITDDNFEQQVLGSDVPVLVDFHADWCQPCRMIAPTIDQLAEQFAGKARVGKVNVDDAPQLAATYDVRSIPSILVFRGGEVAQRFVGMTDAGVLARELEADAAA